MFNITKFKKLTTTIFLAILMPITLGVKSGFSGNGSVSGSSAPIGISSLQTQNVPATSSSVTTVGAPTTSKWSKTDSFTMNFGTGNNRKLTGFTVGNDNYELLQLVNQVKFRRVDNNQVSGERQIFFLERGSNNNQVISSQINSMEEAVRSPYINAGTDNVFANQGGVNYNNIERVDFLIPEGTLVKSEYVDKVGFLLLERGGNDPFKIAPITAVDANGKPTEFGNLVSVPVSTWGSSGININTTVLQNDPSWSALRPSDTVGSQEIKGVFISLASLGIQTNDIIYGYALFPNDINANHDLVGLTDFPTNTSSDSGQGGLDLISSGGIFVPTGMTASQVFTKPPEPSTDVEEEYYCSTSESSSSFDRINVSIEHPGVQEKQVSGPVFEVNFNSANVKGTNGFTQTNGATTYTYEGSLNVKDADQWGGAQGSQYITNHGNEANCYRVRVNEAQKFFGFWWSAGDPHNKLTFKNNGSEVATFLTSDLKSFIDSSNVDNTSAYYGNPAYSGSNTGHQNEPFAFVNIFFDDGQVYDEIVFETTDPQGGAKFESDNHTFSASDLEFREGAARVSNEPPVALDNYDIPEVYVGNTVTIDTLDIVANITDPDLNLNTSTLTTEEITVTAISNVTGGEAQLVDGKVEYTAGDDAGTFTFNYTVEDKHGATDEGTFTVEVKFFAD
ncbi:MAG: Ig-like domain-containing protein [Pleurocapsa sp.]